MKHFYYAIAAMLLVFIIIPILFNHVNPLITLAIIIVVMGFIWEKLIKKIP